MGEYFAWYSQISKVTQLGSCSAALFAAYIRGSLYVLKFPKDEQEEFIIFSISISEQYKINLTDKYLW